jgi:hypothetical protein
MIMTPNLRDEVKAAVEAGDCRAVSAAFDKLASDASAAAELRSLRGRLGRKADAQQVAPMAVAGQLVGLDLKLEKAFALAAARIKALQKRVAELEAAPAMVATGYKDGFRYLPGAHVERNGALYKCIRGTREAPGESDAWEAVSAGCVHYYTHPAAKR